MVSEIFMDISEGLNKDGEVKIPSLGTFKVKKRIVEWVETLKLEKMH